MEQVQEVKRRASATRAQTVTEVRLRNLDALFAGRSFEIVSEVHLPVGQAFRTVVGSLARHGYVLKDRETGEKIAVGFKMLKVIHDRYLGVDLPRKRVIKKTIARINRGE